MTDQDCSRRIHREFFEGTRHWLVVRLFGYFFLLAFIKMKVTRVFSVLLKADFMYVAYLLGQVSQLPSLALV